MNINGTQLTAATVLAIALGQNPSAAAPATFDQEICAAVMVAEAGGESTFAMQAVWEVIVQRSINRRISPSAVVRQPYQFTCLNNTKPSSLISKAKRHRRWGSAMAIAAAKPRTSYTKKADHYHAASMVKRPYWAAGKKPTASVGGHIFYRLKK